MSKLITNVTLGCDPEMFLFSPEKNKFVPVCGLVGGTKEEPLPITEEGHAIQEDNVMLEYCIPPCKIREDYIENIEFTKTYIDETVLKPMGLISKCVASARFNIEDLRTDQAKLFGCSESYNAWTTEINKVNSDDLTLRTAGGHIHVGYDNPNALVSINLIKAMDLFLGVPSILLDTDTERRKMYGKAGEYRLKSYGVEHRTLSTFWTSNKTLMEWVWDSTMAAIEFVNSGGIITNPDDIIRCINNSDKELAKEIIDDYRLVSKLEDVLIKI